MTRTPEVEAALDSIVSAIEVLPAWRRANLQAAIKISRNAGRLPSELASILGAVDDLIEALPVTDSHR